MKEAEVKFRSGELTLEGLLANPGGDAPAAVVCHPHPMYGGSMNNNVVEAILAALWQVGYATLRFNFRGVGLSEGEHDGGLGRSMMRSRRRGSFRRNREYARTAW